MLPVICLNTSKNGVTACIYSASCNILSTNIQPFQLSTIVGGSDNRKLYVSNSHRLFSTRLYNTVPRNSSRRRHILVNDKQYFYDHNSQNKTRDDKLTRWLFNISVFACGTIIGGLLHERITSQNYIYESLKQGELLVTSVLKLLEKGGVDIISGDVEMTDGSSNTSDNLTEHKSTNQITSNTITQPNTECHKPVTSIDAIAKLNEKKDMHEIDDKSASNNNATKNLKSEKAFHDNTSNNNISTDTPIEIFDIANVTGDVNEYIFEYVQSLLNRHGNSVIISCNEDFKELKSDKKTEILKCWEDIKSKVDEKLHLYVYITISDDNIAEAKQITEEAHKYNFDGICVMITDGERASLTDDANDFKGQGSVGTKLRQEYIDYVYETIKNKLICIHRLKSESVRMSTLHKYVESINKFVHLEQSFIIILG